MLKYQFIKSKESDNINVDQVALRASITMGSSYVLTLIIDQRFPEKIDLTC